jgi:hypothetical protein
MNIKALALHSSGLHSDASLMNEIVGGELVISCRDTPTLLDLLKNATGMQAPLRASLNILSDLNMKASLAIIIGEAT